MSVTIPGIDSTLRDLAGSFAPTPAVAMLIDRDGQLLGVAGEASGDSMWAAAFLARELETNAELSSQLLGGQTVSFACEPHGVHVRVVASRAVLVLMIEGPVTGDPGVRIATIAPALDSALAHLPEIGPDELRRLFGHDSSGK